MTSAAVQEEAATDEVVALARALAPLPHGPAPADEREDEDEHEGALVTEQPEPWADDTSAALPRQSDEFTCRRCFLVAHVSRRVRPGDDCCVDCAV